MARSTSLLCRPSFSTRVARYAVVALALAALLLLPRSTAAQTPLLFVDETGTLDRPRIEAAADPLRARGATVVIIVVRAGDDSGDDFARRLDQAGLLAGGQIVPEGIAVYVSLSPRYSELRAGGRWSATLPNSTLAEIRQASLNPSLQAGDFNGAIATTLQALDTRIAATPLSLSWQAVVLLGGTVAAITALLVVVLILRRRRARAESRAAQAANRERARGELAALAESCHAALAGVDQSRLAALERKLHRLDQRRTSLKQLPPDDSTFWTEVNRLKNDYRSLAGSIQAQAATPDSQSASTQSPSAPAPAQPGRLSRNQLDALAAQAHASTKQAAQKGAPPKVRAELHEELQRLDRDRKRLWRKPRRAQDRAAHERELEQLVAGYQQLIHRASQPWHEEESFLSLLRRDYQAGPSAEHTASTTSYSPAESSSSSSEHNRSSDSWSTGSSDSGESRDGGSW